MHAYTQTDTNSKVGAGSCTWIICKNVKQENFGHETLSKNANNTSCCCIVF